MISKTPPCTPKPHQERDWEKVWKRLEGRAFRMKEKVGDILKKLYGRTANTPDDNEDKVHLRTAHSWLVAPFTLWAVDFDGLGRFIYNQVKKGKALDPQMRFLLSLVKDLPSEETQEVIGDYEHIVQQGAYDQLVRDDAKYLARVKELLENPEFHADLAMLKKLFDITKFQSPDTKRIIRRTLVLERNMRHDFLFRWAREDERFQRVFDCFCAKYQLYGIQGDGEPLLMKVTVNPTPHGLMIYIPAWMSLDMWRDLLHEKITELIKARGVLRQGRKVSETRLQNHAKARLVVAADRECKEAGRTGAERLKYIIEKAGFPAGTTARKIRKFRLMGEMLEQSGNVDGQNIAAASVTTTVDSYISTAKITHAKAAFAALSAEEKAEFLKWQSA